MSVSVKQHAIIDRISTLDAYLKTKAFGWKVKNLGKKIKNKKVIKTAKSVSQVDFSQKLQNSFQN